MNTTRKTVPHSGMILVFHSIVNHMTVRSIQHFFKVCLQRFSIYCSKFQGKTNVTDEGKQKLFFVLFRSCISLIVIISLTDVFHLFQFCTYFLNICVGFQPDKSALESILDNTGITLETLYPKPQQESRQTIACNVTRTPLQAAMRRQTAATVRNFNETLLSYKNSYGLIFENFCHCIRYPLTSGFRFIYNKIIGNNVVTFGYNRSRACNAQFLLHLFAGWLVSLLLIVSGKQFK